MVMRGGAALSIRHITGKPINLGVGARKSTRWSRSTQIVSPRVLAWVDVLALIEDIESKVDRAQAEKLATKLKKGDGFDPNDFPRNSSNR